MEDTMNTKTTANSPLNIIALGWGLSAALVVLFVICLAVALVFPEWRGSPPWGGVFFFPPTTSGWGLVVGTRFFLVFGLGAGALPRPCSNPPLPPPAPTPP